MCYTFSACIFEKTNYKTKINHHYSRGCMVDHLMNKKKEQPAIKVGIALAGGGPLGAIYEIGALAAIDEAIEGLNLTQAHIYVGVSAGGFICAGLANGMTPQQMVKLFIEDERKEESLNPTLFLRPAWGEYWKRLCYLPTLVSSGIRQYISRERRSLLSAFAGLGQAIPVGIFNNQAIDTFFGEFFSQLGRTNDFSQLKSKLVLVATELDTGESVEFGEGSLQDVPISKALQASAALPGLFPPVEIKGRYYVDGALKRTLHASVALKENLDLLLCLNPLVAYNAIPDEIEIRKRQRANRRLLRPPRQIAGNLTSGGLPVVLSQTFRSLIHSRMEVGMSRYKTAYPHTDILLFEPNKHDEEMFFTNVFSYASRRQLCEHAYQRTKSELWERRHELQPMLLRHGLRLNLKLLQDESLQLVRTASKKRQPIVSDLWKSTEKLDYLLDDFERWLKVSQLQ
jgi:NTE family protein